MEDINILNNLPNLTEESTTSHTIGSDDTDGVEGYVSIPTPSQVTNLVNAIGKGAFMVCQGAAMVIPFQGSILPGGAILAASKLFRDNCFCDDKKAENKEITPRRE